MTETDLEHPIFIVGPGRSGTTLLRSLLSAHSQMMITPETHFMKQAEEDGGLDNGVPTDFETFWSKYTDSIRFADLGVDADRCLDLVDEQGERTFRNVFAALLAAYGERTGKRRVGEKTPGHVYFIPYLLAWFPEARMVIMQRDPRAIIASQLRSPWLHNHLSSRSVRRPIVLRTRLYQVAHSAKNWVRIYERIVPEWRGDSRVCMVSYEAIVQNVEGEMHKLCDFLGESFEPAMLNDRSSDTVPRPSGTETMGDDAWRQWRREHHAKTLQPVSSDSLDKWREGLTGLEVAMIEGHCERGMRAAGYRPSLSSLQRSAGRALMDTVLAGARTEESARTVARKALRPIRNLIR